MFVHACVCICVCMCVYVCVCMCVDRPHEHVVVVYVLPRLPVLSRLQGREPRVLREGAVS